jgi:hypothetical protein
MPRRGLEPPLSYNENHHLKVARLPIPPPGLVDVRGSIHRFFVLSSPYHMIDGLGDVGLSDLGDAVKRGRVYHPKKVDSETLGADSCTHEHMKNPSGNGEGASMSTDTADTKHKLYEHVRTGAQAADVFAGVELKASGVVCEADGSAEPAFYRVYIEEGAVWISLETEDRWLSGSIEEELVKTGDKLDELLEEEIVDLGHDDAVVEFEHFRSPEKVYIFRSRLSTALHHADAPEHALIWLKGYEAVFSELGDMNEDEED